MRALLVLALLLVAGCLAPEAPLAALREAGAARVVDEAGAPVPFAAVTLLAPGAPPLRLSAGADGALPSVAVAFERALVAAPGFAAREVAARELAGAIVLARADAPDAADPAPILRVLPPVELGGYVLGPEALCDHRNTCGLSEPVIEAGPGGVLYASSVCCVGGSPPVWASRDGGASWQPLATPGVREAIGIEGDLAVDAAGNVYFTDILLGALWITSWDADGTWRHTTPVPLPPLVDRPWVRAGAEDVVYFLYNTGATTNFHRSTDGGRTFLPAPLATFPAALGTLAQGPEAERLWVAAGDMLYGSADGGSTWSAGEDIPRPEGASDEDGHYGFVTLAVDASGRVGVAYDLGGAGGYAVHLAVREADGAWRTSVASPPGGTHVMPWIEAGPDGGFVVAWYGVDGVAKRVADLPADAPWHVWLAATHDAGATWQLARADDTPVLAGPMERRLLDFLQVDLDERGAAHLVYAHNRDGSRNEQTAFVRTTIGLGLPQAPPLAGGVASVRDPLSSYASASLGVS